MQLDAGTLSEGSVLECDLCIVGAGPAGLALAAELAGSALRVIVVESGSTGASPAAATLNEASVAGDPYAGLEVSRHRQIGGTARLWNTPLAPGEGAKFVPLDPLDFQGQQGRPPWPFEFADLEPYYRRAQAVAGLGRFDYDGHGWNVPASPVPRNHPVLESRVYQFGPVSRICEHLPRLIAAAPDIVLYHDATVVRLHWRRSTVESLEVVTSAGTRLSIRARRVILAAGGVENARLLLVEAAAGRMRDQSGWLGRGFMEHPRDYSIVIRSKARDLFRRLEFFDAHAVGETTVCGRIGLRSEAILAGDLPNASITLLPSGRAWRPFHWRVESLAWRRFGISLQWPPGYGWSRLPRAARRFDGFQLLINLEEFPSPDNRLVLEEDARDSMGVPRVRLERRWQAADRLRLARLHETILPALRAIGLGPLELRPLAPPNPDSHHHLGATRIGAEPGTGVTDANGRVFGSENLFVTGASVFPSGGFANPTLTIIALAIRLADHCRSTM